MVSNLVKMYLRTVEAIPPRRSRKRPAEAPEARYRNDPVHGVSRRVREGGYDALLRSFVEGEYGPYAVVVAPVAEDYAPHPDTLYHGFLSARNAGDMHADVDVMQRGEHVYLALPAPDASHTVRAERRASIKATLDGFDRSGERETTLVIGEDRDTLYQAMHYQRTRLGLGNVRVERYGEDGIRLVNTMIEGTPSDPAGLPEGKE